MLRMPQESLSVRTLKASADWCVLSASVDSSLFAGLATIPTPAYPTSKRHANQEVGP